MTHVKKKYLYQFSLSGNIQELYKIHGANFKATLDGTFVKVFSKKLKLDQKEVLCDLPIPDLAIVYYDTAYVHGKKREKLKDQLALKLNSTNFDDENIHNELYRFFGCSCSCIILAFTSIEAFLNANIPYDNNSSDENTTTCNKKKIQGYTTFVKKAGKILPELLGKNIGEIPEMILLLKKLQDDIIHTKSRLDFTVQEQLINDILDFDLEKCLVDIRNFMNFYKPGYIEECDCGKDF